jgi:hypothetical protein
MLLVADVVGIFGFSALAHFLRIGQAVSNKPRAAAPFAGRQFASFGAIHSE